MANTNNPNMMMSLKDSLATLNFKPADIPTSNQDPLEQARRELAECENCTGQPCHKTTYRYSLPDIDADLSTRLAMDCSIPRKICTFAVELNLRKALSRCMVPAKFADKSFDDYEVTADNERAIKLAKLFTASALGKQGLYLYGGAGTGKTFLAALIAQELVRNYVTVIFGDVPTLLDEIKSTFDGKGSAQDIISRYCESDLLILDDLGTGLVTDWSVGILYQIINARYNADKSLLVTSNYSLKGLQSRLSTKDEFSATRIISRLAEMCIPALLGSLDRRRKLI